MCVCLQSVCMCVCSQCVWVSAVSVCVSAVGVCVYACDRCVCVSAVGVYLCIAETRKPNDGSTAPWNHYSHSTQGFPPIHWQSLTNPQWLRLPIHSSSLNYRMLIKKATDNGSIFLTAATNTQANSHNSANTRPPPFSRASYSAPPFLPALPSPSHLSTSYAPRGKFRTERRVL